MRTQVQHAKDDIRSRDPPVVTRRRHRRPRMALQKPSAEPPGRQLSRDAGVTAIGHANDGMALACTSAMAYPDRL